MKHHGVLGIANSLLILGTLGGAAAPQNEIPPEPQPVYLQPSEEQFQRSDFDRIAKWYGARGLGNAATAKLALVQGANAFECPRSDTKGSTVIYATSGLGNYYCGPKNTVVLNVGFLTMQSKSFPQQVVSLSHFNHAHELGHAAQSPNGKLDDMQQYQQTEVAAIEMQATCYAGQVAADLYPEDIPGIVGILESTGIGSSHGGSEGQSQAFQHGANGGECRLEPN